MKLLILYLILSFSILCQGAEFRDAYNLYKEDSRLKSTIRDLSKSSSEAWKNSGGSVTKFLSQDIDDTDCSHCPSHIKLSGDINKIVSKIESAPEDTRDDVELLPVKLNKLKFLYYISKSNSMYQQRPCEVYMPLGSKESLLNNMKGSFKLAYEDILPYENIIELQLYSPNSEEVTYFYRGEGAQSNIFIEAILRPNGKSTFRYYYYTPPEVITGADAKSISEAIQKKDNGDLFKVDTMRYEYRGIIPKDLHLLETEIQKIFYDDYKFNAQNDLAVTGNTLNMSLKNTKAQKDIVSAEVKVKSSSNTTPDFAISVPYEIGYYDNTQIKTNANVDNNGQGLKLTLTDHNITWFNAEVKSDIAAGHTSYYLEKVTHLGPTESFSTSFGKDFNGQYLSLQHRKNIKNYTSMVLDVRYGLSGESTLVYQFEKKF